MLIYNADYNAMIQKSYSMLSKSIISSDAMLFSSYHLSTSAPLKTPHSQRKFLRQNKSPVAPFTNMVEL